MPWLHLASSAIQVVRYVPPERGTLVGIKTDKRYVMQ